MELLENMSICGEGNISMFPERQELLVKFIKEIKPKTLIEIGFNMGHSAILICNTINEIKKTDKEYENQIIDFYIFDICIHECVKPNFKILKEHFKDTINLYLIEGSTIDTIKVFNTLNNQSMDFIEVDGCHTYDCVRNDVMNLWDRLSNNGFMYIDDYKSTKVHLDEVDRGVDSIDWSNFSTNFIDGLFWVKKNTFKINYDYEKIISKNVLFEGVMQDGRQFTINANWNDFDEWNILSEDIELPDATDEELEKIIENFQNKMNG